MMKGTCKRNSGIIRTATTVSFLCYTSVILSFSILNVVESLSFSPHAQNRCNPGTTKIATSNESAAIKNKELLSRKDWLVSTLMTTTALVVTSTSSPSNVNAAETVGKDPLCDDSTCLGVWDGLLADCPHGKLTKSFAAGCASSQDDTPGIFAEPWDYAEAPNNTLDYEEQMRLLIPAIQLVSSRRKDQVAILKESGRYLRVLFTDGKTGEESIGEFYFTPNDTTVQFRVGTVNPNINNANMSKSTKNVERCELIRKELRYQKIPVLRNRKRMLFFVESDFDTFGPSLGAAGEDVDAKMRIDDYPSEFLQSFPSNGGNNLRK
mmetsp:Transcript_10170/g.12889  ORF Transcript_10170/g.12889 Transcript_10170/m.12889 type:complete len:322 (+) Transcript_10170:56-1021(+)